MKYTNKKFDVALSGDAYRKGWEGISWKKDETVVRERPVLCGCGSPLMKDGFCHDCGNWSGRDV